LGRMVLPLCGVFCPLCIFWTLISATMGLLPSSPLLGFLPEYLYTLISHHLWRSSAFKPGLFTTSVYDGAWCSGRPGPGWYWRPAFRPTGLGMIFTPGLWRGPAFRLTSPGWFWRLTFSPTGPGSFFQILSKSRDEKYWVLNFGSLHTLVWGRLSGKGNRPEEVITPILWAHYRNSIK
jgi:hypothetical protein